MTSVESIHSRAALERRFGPSYRWRVLATVMIGTVASIMASTIVNVAVPDMAHVFALGQERAQWLSAGFMGAMTLSMLTTPWLLDRYGYRHTYIGAVALLMVGGVVGGFGSHFEVILAMRVTEGLAAGVLQPIPAIIILHAFGEGERGKAMGIFGFGVVLAPAVGPERRRRAGRVVGLALDLLRGHAVLPDRDGDGAPLPADRRARRRADRSRRRPARPARPRPDRGRGAGAAQRHGPSQCRDAGRSAWR